MPTKVVVEAARGRRGGALGAAGLGAVAAAAANPDTLADYQRAFPWATAHQTDATAGNPPYAAQVVAHYWVEVWDRLNGDDAVRPAIIDHWPPGEGYGQPTSADDFQSVLSVSFAHGLVASSVQEGLVEVRDAAGRCLPGQPQPLLW